MTGDMIVNLYSRNQWSKNCEYVRNLFVSDLERMVEFMAEKFPDETGWIHEITRAIMNDTCVVAVQNGKIIGFACWDATAKGYFGPFGVAKEHRNKGIGTDIFCECMNQMKKHGYGYCIIGWVSEKACEFYKKVGDAVYIPGSSPSETLYSRKVSL